MNLLHQWDAQYELDVIAPQSYANGLGGDAFRASVCEINIGAIRMSETNHQMVRTVREMSEAFAALEAPGRPTFFSLALPLPSQGAVNTAVAATGRMTVMLKAYAASGENALHAHPNEDHVFFVLQGKACFHGPAGEMRSVSAGEGVMLPHGTLYWFIADEAQPLVMVRVGSTIVDGADPFARIDPEGASLPGDSAKNKQAEPILSGQWFGAKS